MLEKGGLDGYAVWKRILRAVEALQGGGAGAWGRDAMSPVLVAGPFLGSTLECPLCGDKRTFPAHGLHLAPQPSGDFGASGLLRPSRWKLECQNLEFGRGYQ